MAKLLLLLLCLSSCVFYAIRPAEPGPRATSKTEVIRRADRPPRYIVTVNNPTSEDVFIDCEEARIRVQAHTQQDVLLTDSDEACDLKNDGEYGALPTRVNRRHGPRNNITQGP